jgi:hypothetical protein
MGNKPKKTQTFEFVKASDLIRDLGKTKTAEVKKPSRKVEDSRTKLPK